ncbi:MAG: hypothetical protein ACRC28_10750, partial [Clostridium sp.]|uniref:hypothetical protein n=1 Tax=Clostridium sp. TaxID=1506 RepID=UPI003F2AF9B1
KAINSRYIAIPLASFHMIEKLKKYYEREEKPYLKDLITSYCRAFYNIGGVLPITDIYKDIPFIQFESNSLEPLRKAGFSSKNIFCSTEINILNLLLLE